MGYTYVIHCDDRTARTLDDDTLGRALLDAVGTDTYPGRLDAPRSVGPFTVVAACHSHTFHVFDVQPDGTTEVPTDRFDDGAVGVVPTVSAGALHDRVRELQRHPHRLAMPGTFDALHRPDPQLAGSAASLWWLYADHLHQRPDDVVAVGAHVRRLLDTNLPVVVSGWAAAALHKAFAVLAGGEAIAVCAGNRVCLADDLTESERRLLEQRRRRPFG